MKKTKKQKKDFGEFALRLLGILLIVWGTTNIYAKYVSNNFQRQTIESLNSMNRTIHDIVQQVKHPHDKSWGIKV